MRFANAIENAEQNITNKARRQRTTTRGGRAALERLVGADLRTRRQRRR